MTQKRICECCGQRIRKLNPHVMCKQKVRLLEVLAKAYIAGDEWVKCLHGSAVRIDGELSRAPYRAEAHASRLAWFGLAEHGEVRSGLYRITPFGFDFLLGRALVPLRIWCRDGVVVERDPRMVGIASVRGVILDKAYWDSYALRQKPAPDQPELPL